MLKKTNIAPAKTKRKTMEGGKKNLLQAQGIPSAEEEQEGKKRRKALAGVSKKIPEGGVSCNRFVKMYKDPEEKKKKI